MAEKIYRVIKPDGEEFKVKVRSMPWDLVEYTLCNAQIMNPKTTEDVEKVGAFYKLLKEKCIIGWQKVGDTEWHEGFEDLDAEVAFTALDKIQADAKTRVEVRIETEKKS